MLRMTVMIVAALAARGGYATAQTVSPTTPVAGASPLSLELPPPADTGKPHLFALPLLSPPTGCAAAFDCRLRVIGTVEHNGAVMHNATAFKW
jgi:hypothetical protein